MNYMKKMVSKFIPLFIALSVTMINCRAQAAAEREFIMSCTYGVLAGTLVGAATLAFVEKPGDHLQSVARGASLGLYLGIGLGIYTVYLLPKQLEKDENKLLDEQTEGPSSRLPNFMVFPLVADRGVEGVGAFWQVARF